MVPTPAFTLRPLGVDDLTPAVSLVAALLEEVAVRAGARLAFDPAQARACGARALHAGQLHGFLALGEVPIGVALCYEAFALYAGGTFGVLSELYVSPPWRHQGVGQALVTTVRALARERQWHSIEVTTPPLPAFDETLRFYEAHGFAVSGGRKLRWTCPRSG